MKKREPPAKRKSSSGPSGKHRQKGFILREERGGQIDDWRAAAEREEKSLSNWARDALDREANK